MDMSFPPGNSVNDGIDKCLFLGDPVDLKYPAVDDLVKLVKRFGRGTLLFKVDLKAAFRQIPVDPGDYHLLGYEWDDHLFIDLVLAMGLRSAAYCCQRLTNAIAFIYSNMGYHSVNYLDDFGCADHADAAERAFAALQDLLGRLGVEESRKKACPPNTTMVFLGVQFDTINLTLEVPQSRLHDIRAELEVWLSKDTTSIKQVQSLIGKLVFISKCVPSSRIFLGRLLHFLRGMDRDKEAHLSQEFRQDIVWWYKYVGVFNGVSMMHLEDWTRPDEFLECDACLEGCGAICCGEYFAAQFPIHVKPPEYNINMLELLCINVALKLWGAHLVGKKLLVHCDNMVAVECINNGKTRNPYLQACIRELLYIACINNFQIKAVHIRGRDNRASDSLSRLHMGGTYDHQFKQATIGRALKRVYTKDSMFDVEEFW